MYLIVSQSLGVHVARGISRASFGRLVNLSARRWHGNDQSARCWRQHIKWLERKPPLGKSVGTRSNAQKLSSIKYLFVFPLVPAVVSNSSKSSIDDSKSFLPMRTAPPPQTSGLRSYSTRGSLVKYLYKTWDLIRFVLRLSKFVFLYSPFLFTYPLCCVSTFAEDVWWILLKKAIVIGGPITVEFARWLGTREDLFLHKTCLNLASVSHRENPHSWYSTKKKLRRALGNEWKNTVVQFEPPRTEIANSELAQVYKAKIPLEACADQVADEIVKEVDDFEGLDEPFLSDGIEIVGLGAWMSGHDDDDIVDSALGSWMMTKQGLAQSSGGAEQGPRCAPIVLPSQLDVSSSDGDLSEEKPKLRERVRDRIQTVQLKAAEKFVHVVGRGLDACNNAFARSYALMAKVGTMRQELQIVPDPFDLTPAIPPKPVAESIAVDDAEDKLYLEELLPETNEVPLEELSPSSELAALNCNNNNNNNNNSDVNANEDGNGNHHINICGDIDASEESSQLFASSNDGNGTSEFDPIAVEKGSSPASESFEFVEPFPAAESSGEAARLSDATSLLTNAVVVPDVIMEKVVTLKLAAAEEIREKIPDLTPEEVAIDEIVEGTEETQPHIPESVSEGVEALLQIGAEAVKSATEGVKEGVAQVKESVAPFVESDQEEELEPSEPVLLRFHPEECVCRLCQGLVPVAVKVLHPGIVRKTILDLELLSLLASVVQTIVPWMNWWLPATCVEEFGDRIHRMINLKREAIALERFNINFIANPHVRFPRPMRPFVHRDVMVEMWEESDSIQHYLMTEDGEEDRSQMPFSLRSSLAEIISETLVKMIFDDNYVHCDIDERNVLVQNGKYFIENPPDKDKLMQVEVMDTIVIATEENKSPLRLVLCDADNASSISQPRAFSNIFEGIITRDPILSADGFEAFISESSRTKDLTKFKDELRLCFLRHSVSRDGKKSPDLSLLVEDLYRLMYYNRVKMEDDFVAVLTSMLSVEKIGKKLIGTNQNLFDAIEKHFAKQFDKEQI